jgi:hypothetical protein
VGTTGGEVDLHHDFGAAETEIIVARCLVRPVVEDDLAVAEKFRGETPGTILPIHQCSELLVVAV